MKYKLVVDLTTDRIIWFSDNVDEDIPSDEQSVIVFYEGDLPNDINHNNCWQFTYKNKKITKKIQSTKVEKTLIEQNRESITSFVKSEIESCRQKKFPVSPYDFYIHYFLRNEMEKNFSSFWKDVLSESDIGTEKYENQLEKVKILESYQLEEFLAKTERLKLVTLREIKLAKTNEELFEIKNEFKKILKIIEKK